MTKTVFSKQSSVLMPWTACLFLRETRVGKQMCGSGCCTCRSWYKFPELWAEKLWQQQVIANQWESGLVQGDEREDFPERGQKRKKKKKMFPKPLNNAMVLEIKLLQLAF